MTDPVGDAARAYRGRLDGQDRLAAEMERRHQRMANLRLALLLVFLVLLVLSLRFKLFTVWLCVLPVAAFIPLAFAHDGVLRSRRRARRAAEFYRRGLDRMEDRWAGVGATGDGFLDPAHPYAADLDLFGQGSLFQLLCQAKTRSGEECLARWLLEPAAVGTIRQRQEAVEELRGALDLREHLAVLGEEWQSSTTPDRLTQWCLAPPLRPSQGLRAQVWGLTSLSLATVLAWIAFGIHLAPVAVLVILQILLRRRLRPVMGRASASADRASADLELLGTVLACFERGSFRSPLLQTMQVRVSGDPAASRSLRRLRLLVDCFEARRNQLFAPFAYGLLWDVHFAFAIESWRLRVGSRAPGWLETVGEFEALSSLAAYAYEHPEDPFPHLSEGPASRLAAEGLGHPLLDDRSCVRNDLVLEGAGDGAPDRAPALLVVSGSNMSGKSTLLRAVGVAVVMAQAGSPVRARHLSLSPLRLAASIRVLDSLQAHVSHFYAEIQRLRRITELVSGDRPVLFLIDEMLQGTNSRDRFIGSGAVLRGFLARGALGMITTHDLALTELVETLGVPACNVHFEDQLAVGQLLFDYRLRPGVVSRSNALELMRMVGLEVPDAREADRRSRF